MKANMKPQGGRSIEGLPLGQGAGCQKNTSGVPAGRGVSHLTSPYIGLLASLGQLPDCRSFEQSPNTFRAPTFRLHHHGMVSFSQRVNVPVGPSGPSSATRTTSREPSSTEAVPSYPLRLVLVALMEALQCALSLNARRLHVYSDSEIVVRQMTGEYKCRSPRLYSLNWTCRKLARSLEFSISHVGREKNVEANTLANLAARSCSI